jgi:hypothetical protein
MISATVAGVAEFCWMPVEVVATGSPAFRATNVLGSQREEVLETPLVNAEALRKIAVVDGAISHRIVNIVLSSRRVHGKSSGDMSGVVCTSQKRPAKSLSQPPFESSDRCEEVVLSPDLSLPFGRRDRHLFRLDVCESQISEESPELLSQFLRRIRVEGEDTTGFQQTVSHEPLDEDDAIPVHLIFFQGITIVQRCIELPSLECRKVSCVVSLDNFHVFELSRFCSKVPIQFNHIVRLEPALLPPAFDLPRRQSLAVPNLQHIASVARDDLRELLHVGQLIVRHHFMSEDIGA